MVLSVTRTLVRSSSSGAGNTVRESDMGGLDSSAGFYLLAACRTSSPKARKNRFGVHHDEVLGEAPGGRSNPGNVLQVLLRSSSNGCRGSASSADGTTISKAAVTPPYKGWGLSHCSINRSSSPLDFANSRVRANRQSPDSCRLTFQSPP